MTSIEVYRKNGNDYATVDRSLLIIKMQGPYCVTPGYWVTKDRRLMKISEMTPDHRRNAAKLLKRKITHLCDGSYYDPMPCATCDFNAPLQDKIDELIPSKDP